MKDVKLQEDVMDINRTYKESTNKTYKEYVIEEVKKEIPFKKRSKYSYDYYYDMFILVLKEVNSWRSLKITAKYGDKKENHHTTIRKMFNKWSEKEIFKKAYDKMRKGDINGNDKEINLFIDSTYVNNKTGVELVGINPMYYKKRVTKISIICDEKKRVIIAKPFKSTRNDCATIIETVKEINKGERINLIGDKGYILNKDDMNKLLKEKNIRLIVPRKKNQKEKRIRKKYKNLLKKRNVIENVIQEIKRYNRIYTRKDKRIHNYMSFVYMASGINYKNKID